MNVLNRSRPFQRIRTPGILSGTLTKANGCKEVPYECHLSKCGDDRCPCYEYVDRNPFFHKREFSKRVIATWHAVDAHKVHREEHHVCADKRKPEVKVAQFFVHHPAK